MPSLSHVLALLQVTGAINFPGLRSSVRIPVKDVRASIYSLAACTDVSVTGEVNELTELPEVS